jgi:hypothetical protein
LKVEPYTPRTVTREPMNRAGNRPTPRGSKYCTVNASAFVPTLIHTTSVCAKSIGRFCTARTTPESSMKSLWNCGSANSPIDTRRAGGNGSRPSTRHFTAGARPRPT